MPNSAVPQPDFPDSPQSTTDANRDITLPAGRYLTLCNIIRAHTGGQTRAMIMRNRLITRHAGIPTTLLTTEPVPIYPEVRESLREQGQLIDGMQLLNAYEWYRDADLSGDQPKPSADDLGERIVPLPEATSTEELHPDGTVYFTSYRRWNQEIARDYRRADGTVFLRTPGADATVSRKPWVLVGHDGRPLRGWKSLGAWYWDWFRRLVGDAQRVFLVTDSRFALREITPRRDRRFYITHLVHNNHLVGERRWDSPLSPDYAPLFERIRYYDGLVSLTHRQSEDIAKRFGPTNNLYVVPNPVEPAPLPAVLPPRRRATFISVTRLVAQKRLNHAIRAFAKVVAERDQAELQIYGDGILRDHLASLIDSLGIGDHVKLMGYDPRAKDAMLHATGFLMSSVNEGYPLATLESMSYGCPVVSYDINYGPREQITDGVDGFLVDAGDIDAMAARCIQMIDSPELVAKMSQNALAKAAAHDHRAFLRDWRAVFEKVVEIRRLQVRDASAELTVHTLGWRPVEHPTVPERVRSRLAKTAPAPAERGSGSTQEPPDVEFAATLTVTGTWRKGVMNDRIITLDALCSDTGEIVSLPIEDRPGPRGVFHLSSRFSLDDVFGRLSADAHHVSLRLRFTAHNWSWETTLARPAEQRPAYEISFAADDSMHLHRPGEQARP